MDHQKVTEVEQWLIPKSIKSLRGFLGLTGYYCRFTYNYGKMTRPLTQLLKKGSFEWTNENTEAMQKLKAALTTAPVLSLLDFSKSFVIECDAFEKGIGAVLSQNKKPIAFFSEALAETSMSKSIYEKELTTLVLPIQHWRSYLVGRRFMMCTDQKSFRHLLEQRITTQNQQNWLANLLDYEFDIIYKPRVTNKVVDALSRAFGEEEGNAAELGLIYLPYWRYLEEIEKVICRNSKLQKIVTELMQNPESNGKYTLENGKLHYKGRLVLLAKSVWIPKLL